MNDHTKSTIDCYVSPIFPYRMKLNDDRAIFKKVADFIASSLHFETMVVFAVAVVVWVDSVKMLLLLVSEQGIKCQMH